MRSIAAVILIALCLLPLEPVISHVAAAHPVIHANGTPILSTSESTVDLSGTWSFTPKGGPETTIAVPGGGWYKQGFTTTAEAVYSRTITIPPTDQPHVYKLEFGAINHEASLYVNGQFVQTNLTSFTPSVFDITRFVRPGQTYAISIDVKGRDALTDSAGHYLVPDAADYPPSFAHGIPQGIFRSAALRIYPQVYIDDAFIRTSVSTNSLSYDVWMTNGSTAPYTLTLSGILSSWNGDSWAYPRLPDNQVVVAAGETRKVTINSIPWNLGPASYWWPDVPYTSGYVARLHILTLTLTTADGVTEDVEGHRFGFREFTQQGQHYLLNGVRVNLRGDSLFGADYDDIDYGGIGDAYDTYPGFLPPSDANPGWPQAVDNYLRLNYNFVRIAQEPATPYMLDVADEKGLMILDESAIRGSYNMQNFIAGHDNMVSHVQDLVRRDRNHPAVVRWGQSNEPDNSVFDSVAFEQDLYHAIMAEDPTRPVSIDTVSLGDQYIGPMTYTNFTVMPHYVHASPHMVDGTLVGFYTQTLYVRPDRPFGQGEYIWPSSRTPQGVAWMATATVAMRQQEAADLRPYALLSAWPGFIPGVKTTDMPLEEGGYGLYGADNLPDPWSNRQIQRLQDAFNPVLVADQGYWDLNHYSDANGDWPAIIPSYGFAQTITRTLDVYNDTFSGSDIDVTWQVRVDDPDGPVSSSGSLHVNVPLGDHVEQPITIVTPSSGSRFYLVLSAQKNSVALFDDSAEYFYLNDNPPGTLVFDDSNYSAHVADYNQFAYNGTGWTHCASSCGANGTMAFDDTLSTDASPDDTASVLFNGSQAVLYGLVGPDHGIAAISIDGAPEVPLDCYAPAEEDGVLWASPLLPPGNHTLTVRVTGTKNGLSAGTSVSIDRADAVPMGVEPPMQGQATPTAIPVAASPTPTVVSAPTDTPSATAPMPSPTVPFPSPPVTFSPTPGVTVPSATPLPLPSPMPSATPLPLLSPIATVPANYSPPVPTPSPISHPVASVTPAEVLPTVPVATGTASPVPGIPAAPTAQPSATVGATLHRPSPTPTAQASRSRVAGVPLRVGLAPARVVSGEWLRVRVRTAAHGAITLALTVEERISRIVPKGAGWERVSRSWVLYRITHRGTATGAGLWTSRLKIGYAPWAAMQARVNVRVAHGGMTRQAHLSITIMPRSHNNESREI